MENFKIDGEQYKMDIQNENGECSRLTDPIDLDNKMRVVYRKRVESAQQFRHSVCLGDIDYGSKDYSKNESVPKCQEPPKPSLSGMDAAMERLRSEMVSID
ncbi:hypothetical protein FSP39_016767 [Pinctada imbricata]|uniref:Uncharacterized protein n=1 Tax=Pinctada imbricata TaxID=66713 RepID=A0AA89BR70_PINIB|nr:hypothetical protein FSP39_016767 [Pinctada imbricata]